MTKHSTHLFIYEQYPNSQRFSLEDPRRLFARIDAELVTLFGAKKLPPTPSQESISKILAFAQQGNS